MFCVVNGAEIGSGDLQSACARLVDGWLGLMGGLVVVMSSLRARLMHTLTWQNAPSNHKISHEVHTNGFMKYYAIIGKNQAKILTGELEVTDFSKF